MKSKKTVSILFVAGMLSMGCNVCEDLDTRMCADLGEEDCALWKEQGLNFVAQAKTRPRAGLKQLLFGPDANSCQSAGSDAVYPQILEGAKMQIAALRKAEAAKAAAGLK